MSEQSVIAQQRPLQVRRGAKALITAGDRILLTKEAHEDGSQFWTLPGGGVEPGESDTVALKRELGEELQCRIDVVEQATTVWYAHTSSDRLSLYVVYDCDLKTPPEPNPAEGIFDCRWMKANEIAPSTIQQVRYLLDNSDCSQLL